MFVLFVQAHTQASTQASKHASKQARQQNQASKQASMHAGRRNNKRSFSSSSRIWNSSSSAKRPSSRNCSSRPKGWRSSDESWKLRRVLRPKSQQGRVRGVLPYRPRARRLVSRAPSKANLSKLPGRSQGGPPMEGPLRPPGEAERDLGPLLPLRWTGTLSSSTLVRLSTSKQ